MFRLTFRFSRRTSITADEKNSHGRLINLHVLPATQMGRSCWFYMAASSVGIHVIGHMTAGKICSLNSRPVIGYGGDTLYKNKFLMFLPVDQ